MANESSENGNTKGLGWIKNSIEQLNVKTSRYLMLDGIILK